MKHKFSKLIAAALVVGTTFASTTAMSAEMKELEDWQYMGYRITHHMKTVVEHIEEYGINTFMHQKIADYRSFVITPALDHLYSKAVADVRFGPAVITIPARDDRYASIQIVDMEHHTTYAKTTAKEGERFVLIHEDYKGKLPEGTVIKTKSNFPFVFLRTQSFDFNNDKLADSIRRNARIDGISEPIDLPDVTKPRELIKWTYDNKTYYKKTKPVMAEAAKKYTPQEHKATYAYLGKYLASGAVHGNPGMFEDVNDPDGGDQRLRAAGTVIGHLGFPVYHAYYQNVNVDATGKTLNGKNGPFTLTVPYEPGVGKFWSMTRYSGKTWLPLNPAEIGGNDIQAYNTFNMKPDANNKVTFTFSVEDPKDGTYWMPVKADEPYYFIMRYYEPLHELNGNTGFDIIYADTKLEKEMAPIKF